MKIIFLNRYFFPDHSATSQMASDLAFYLSTAGHSVHVITSRQLYDSPHASLSRCEVINGVTIHRVWTSGFGRSRLLGRAFDYLSFYLSASMALLKLCTRGTVVVAKTDPPLISVPAAWVCTLRGGRLVNWLQDVFPEVGVELGVKALSGTMGYLARRLRDRSLLVAATNVAIGRHMADLVKRLGVPSDRISVIQNWADGGAIVPVAHEENPVRHQWQLDGKFVAMYSGNMGRAHEFKTMLDAADLLQSDPRIVFIFVGGGNQKGLLGDEVKRRKLTNIKFHPYQPRELLASSLSAGDLHLISLRPELEGLIVPSKVYGVLAAGRPAIFVGSKDGEIASLLREGDCGLTVTEGDPGQFASAVTFLANNPDECRRFGENARRLFDSALTAEHAFKTWEHVLMRA